MPTRERNNSGRYVETLTLETVREAVSNAPDPIATTKEVADALGCSREAARLKLTELHDAGRIERRNVGSKAIVWWVPDVDDAATDDEGAGETSNPARGKDIAPSGVSPADAPAPGSSNDGDTGTGDVETAIATADLPGSGDKLDARRDALRAAVGYLRDHGTATPADFKRDVYPDHPARHTTGEDPPNAWWKRSIYPGLRELADRTGVIRRADTAGEWTWIGGDGGGGDE